MGKHRRRKRQGKKSESSPTTNDTDTDTKSSGILQRIRHADPRTRHAALTALTATLLDSEPLLSSSSRRKHPSHLFSTELIQAVRERVLDEDLECAQAAAHCLGLYVKMIPDQKQDITAGWIVVLLQRLKQCREILSSEMDSNDNSNKNGKKSRKQWWAVASQCLEAFCALVEGNPKALERLNHLQDDSCIGTLLGLLLLGRNELDTQSTVASMTSSDEDEDEWIPNVTVYSVRTLHSALDDNIELLLPSLQKSSLPDENGWDAILETACKHATLPMPARLHAAGCLVTARQLLMQQSMEDWNAWQEILHRRVLKTALPLLQGAVEFHPNIASALLVRYIEAKTRWEQEQADSALERDVIKTVNDRKEPARLIARRQKAIKEQKEQQKQDEMEQENDDEEAGDTLPDRSDKLGAMEKSRSAWNAALLPLQLALEISTNMTSAMTYDDSDGMHDDAIYMNEDTDMEWGPDQEAQLMSAPQNAVAFNEAEVSPLNSALMNALATSGFADRVVVCLKAVYSPLDLPSGAKVPVDAKGDLDEVQSRCAACLGNCLANLANWAAADSRSMWMELRTIKENFPAESHGTGEEVISNAMMLACRARPQLRKQIQADDLEFLLRWASCDSSSHQPSVQRDIVCILGVLCTEEHSAEVNAKVCSILLGVLKASASAMVLSEVLNALMDIYGSDVHTNVFDSMGVLGYFQQRLPVFKKRIQAEFREFSPEEVDQWRETALNAARFISYKKGQL